MENVRLVPHEELAAAAKEILEGCGAPADKATLVAESLVGANLRGVDSHGVHLLGYYVEHIRHSHMRPEAEGRIASESGACLVYDGERAFGQVVSRHCCGHAIRLAEAHGLGMVTARNSNHFGAAAFWGQRMSEAGMLGIALCNASAAVPPWQGREGRVGTNPICVSSPSTGDGAWLLDMATTTVAKNKIARAAANNVPSIPLGWGMNDRGEPTTNPQEATLVMPLGGYKGSGLGLMVEILCAVLSGGAMSTDVGGTYLFDRAMSTSQMFLAIDVRRFLPADEYQARMESLITTIKSAAPATGYSEVMVAGDPEWRIEKERLENGIPVDGATWDLIQRFLREG
jgi:LDH2 family malate/lactate/ureidoglycolate dehydrogenase